jgi:serine/alanine adding enzyme
MSTSLLHITTDPNLIDKSHWLDFVVTHPKGNAFQTPGMYEVYAKTKNYEPVLTVLVNDEGTIQALLMAVIQKDFRGALGFLSSRAIITGGPLVRDEDGHALSLLIKSFTQSIKRKAIYIQFRNFSLADENFNKHFILNGYSFLDHYNIVLDLRAGGDTLYNGFSRSRKKGIKKARAYNFTFDYNQEGKYLGEFYDLLTKTYFRIGLPIPERGHFTEITKVLTNKQYAIFTISKEGRIVTALLTLIFRKTVYGYYMGTVNDSDILRQKPVDLLFWEVFRWAAERDFHYFDWMGAGTPGKSYGVRDFKLQYGGGLANFGRFERINKPIVYRISKFGLKIWKKIRL